MPLILLDILISNTAVVTKRSEEYISPAGNALGAPGAKQFTFQALAAGSSQITFQYKRGEAGTAADTKTFSVTVLWTAAFFS